ncbi:MAG: MotA/TolQ/ExbB proton channel family protein [Gammaproteobacteria bacterium]|nr:MotA/TolQ/ExbB proton channel family protein [Gammaproteobacteria bacterium]
MSLFSWLIILDKTITLLQTRYILRKMLESFWAADSLEIALQKLLQRDKSHLFANLASDAIKAETAWEGHHVSGIAAKVDKSEFIARTLQQSVVFAQARCERGLTLLASVGSTAPFIGLFGTVWGIYHALIALSGATQIALDRVAGPVGEALIMTAAGLIVAIPAVLAYNAITRANRLILAQLDHFAHNLYAYLVGGITLHGHHLNQPTPPYANSAHHSETPNGL